MKNKLKVEIFDIKSMLKYNIPLALESFEELYSEIKKKNEKIDTLNNDKDKLLMEIKMIEDKLIEATKPWYLKLKDKLTKFGIRNPFYLTDGGS